MDQAQIYAELKIIFDDVFMREDIQLNPTLSAKDVDDWDSMRQVEILMASEERFGVKFSTREIDSLKQVGDLVSLIESQTTSKK
jgi:acyl carrier protein